MTQFSISTHEGGDSRIEVDLYDFVELVKNSARVDSLMSIVNATSGKYIDKAMVYAVFGAEVPDKYKSSEYD